MAIIYGVDTDKQVTPEQVRDAVIECFKQAHSAVLKSDFGKYVEEMKQEEFEKLKEINVAQMVRGYFKEVGGDFEKPTKEMIIKVCDKLAEFAENFRAHDIIKKHYGEIMQLVNKL